MREGLCAHQTDIKIDAHCTVESSFSSCAHRRPAIGMHLGAIAHQYAKIEVVIMAFGWPKTVDAGAAAAVDVCCAERKSRPLNIIIISQVDGNSHETVEQNTALLRT